MDRMNGGNILSEIKNLVGLDSEYDAFDVDVLMHINTYVMVLRQIGVGPVGGYEVTKDSTWSDYLGEDVITKLSAVRTYIYLKVKLIFDPPTSSAVMEAMKQTASEIEVRLNMEVDPGESSTKEVNDE